MLATALLALSAALPLAIGQQLNNETVLGVYMFHRHGDRTAKITGNANLTDLGYLEVYQSGQYYRSRYIDANAPLRISGINTDLVLQSQIQVSAPIDDVLQNSATGFLQALYPPVGTGLDTELLRNGTTVTAPMQGYQLIPLGVAESGSGSEDAGWLQSTSSCAKAEISSNNYFLSDEYIKMLNTTEDFYSRILPFVSGEFNSTTNNFKNAYEIYDYVNVAEIHNATIPHANLINDTTFYQLLVLANIHEYNLAYNKSEPIRAVDGATLAAQIYQFLNDTVAASGSFSGPKIGIQFGSYNYFTSFFGLADVLPGNPDLYGVADYASSMVFEMFTNTSTAVTTANYPSDDDIYVRMLFHNGTASNSTPPVPYPLFGSGQEVVSWKDFTTGINKFAIGDQASWCHACGNSTGICSPAALGEDTSSGGSGSSEGGSSGECFTSGNGLSPAVNGVIGAMVTLAVVLGLEALVMLVLGLRLVSKKRLAGGAGSVFPPSNDPVKA